MSGFKSLLYASLQKKKLSSEKEQILTQSLKIKVEVQRESKRSLNSYVHLHNHYNIIHFHDTLEKLFRKIFTF